MSVQALEPMRNVLLRLDPARAAVGRHFLETCRGQIVEEQRNLREQRIDRVRCGQPPVRVAEDIGLACHRASGSSMV